MAVATTWISTKHPRSKKTGKFVDVIGRLQAMGAEFDKSSGDWHVPKSKQADLVTLLDELGAGGLPVTPLSANEVSALKAGKGANGPTLQSLAAKGLVDADGNLTDAGKNAQAQVKKPPLAKSQKKRIVQLLEATEKNQPIKESSPAWDYFKSVGLAEDKGGGVLATPAGMQLGAQIRGDKSSDKPLETPGTVAAPAGKPQEAAKSAPKANPPTAPGNTPTPSAAPATAPEPIVDGDLADKLVAPNDVKPGQYLKINNKARLVLEVKATDSDHTAITYAVPEKKSGKATRVQHNQGQALVFDPDDESSALFIGNESAVHIGTKKSSALKEGDVLDDPKLGLGGPGVVESAHALTLAVDKKPPMFWPSPTLDEPTPAVRVTVKLQDGTRRNLYLSPDTNIDGKFVSTNGLFIDAPEPAATKAPTAKPPTPSPTGDTKAARGLKKGDVVTVGGTTLEVQRSRERNGKLKVRFTNGTSKTFSPTEQVQLGDKGAVSTEKPATSTAGAAASKVLSKKGLPYTGPPIEKLDTADKYFDALHDAIERGEDISALDPHQKDNVFVTKQQNKLDPDKFFTGNQHEERYFDLTDSANGDEATTWDVSYDGQSFGKIRKFAGSYELLTNDGRSFKGAERSEVLASAAEGDSVTTGTTGGALPAGHRVGIAQEILYDMARGRNRVPTPKVESTEQIQQRLDAEGKLPKLEDEPVPPPEVMVGSYAYDASWKSEKGFTNLLKGDSQVQVTPRSNGKSALVRINATDPEESKRLYVAIQLFQSPTRSNARKQLAIWKEKNPDGSLLDYVNENFDELQKSYYFSANYNTGHIYASKVQTEKRRKSWEKKVAKVVARERKTSGSSAVAYQNIPHWGTMQMQQQSFDDLHQHLRQAARGSFVPTFHSSGVFEDGVVYHRGSIGATRGDKIKVGMVLHDPTDADGINWVVTEAPKDETLGGVWTLKKESPTGGTLDLPLPVPEDSLFADWQVAGDKPRPLQRPAGGDTGVSTARVMPASDDAVVAAFKKAGARWTKNSKNINPGYKSTWAQVQPGSMFVVEEGEGDATATVEASKKRILESINKWAKQRVSRSGDTKPAEVMGLPQLKAAKTPEEVRLAVNALVFKRFPKSGVATKSIAVEELAKGDKVIVAGTTHIVAGPPITAAINENGDEMVSVPFTDGSGQSYFPGEGAQVVDTTSKFAFDEPGGMPKQLIEQPLAALDKPVLGAKRIEYVPHDQQAGGPPATNAGEAPTSQRGRLTVEGYTPEEATAKLKELGLLGDLEPTVPFTSLMRSNRREGAVLPLHRDFVTGDAPLLEINALLTHGLTAKANDAGAIADSILGGGGLHSIAERYRRGIKVQTASPLGDIGSGIDHVVFLAFNSGSTVGAGASVRFALKPEAYLRRDVALAPRDFGGGHNRYNQYRDYHNSLRSERRKSVAVPDPTLTKPELKPYVVPSPTAAAVFGNKFDVHSSGKEYGSVFYEPTFDGTKYGSIMHVKRVNGKEEWWWAPPSGARKKFATQEEALAAAKRHYSKNGSTSPSGSASLYDPLPPAARQKHINAKKTNPGSAEYNIGSSVPVEDMEVVYAADNKIRQTIEDTLERLLREGKITSRPRVVTDKEEFRNATKV
jgi:hypothetical protein